MCLVDFLHDGNQFEGTELDQLVDCWDYVLILGAQEGLLSHAAFL